MPSITFSKALIHGSRHGDWKTTPRSGPGPVSSFPARIIAPSVSGFRPATIDNTVDLPHPEWPIRQTNSPFLIERSKSFTITAGPFAPGYTFVTLDKTT